MLLLDRYCVGAVLFDQLHSNKNQPAFQPLSGEMAQRCCGNLDRQLSHDVCTLQVDVGTQITLL